MKKISLLMVIIILQCVLSVNVYANNWLLFLPAILAGKGTAPPVVPEKKSGILLFLPAILSGAKKIPVIPVEAINLNDTGITWDADYPTGNNTTCSGGAEFGSQDCSRGRDVNSDDSDGHAGFSFTKLDSNGGDLVATENSWACVRDNITGLIWEVKTDANKIAKFEWPDIQGVADSANSNNLCGASSGWRVPTVKELVSIVSFHSTGTAVDLNYFLNTSDSIAYWSETPASVFLNEVWSEDKAWIVGFKLGNTNQSLKTSFLHVRLVRTIEE